MATKAKITKAYMEFELMEGRAPHSVFELCKKIKIEEEAFYKLFSSLTSVQEEILAEFLTRTQEIVDKDLEYPNYNAREKTLAIFFTLFAQFEKSRSYFLAKYSSLKDAPKQFKEWDAFMNTLDYQLECILQEAKQSSEVIDRPYIGAHYSKGFKLVFTYVFRVWINDTSEGFTTTDAAIEKSVNLSFDMLGTSPLDSLIDFGKFAFKTKI
jgi:hypothetical protein